MEPLSHRCKKMEKISVASRDLPESWFAPCQRREPIFLNPPQFASGCLADSAVAKNLCG